MPKPQVTLLIDHLVKSGVVKRHQDLADWPVINLAMSQRRGLPSEDLREKAQEIIEKALMSVGLHEFADMSEALKSLRRIGTTPIEGATFGSCTSRPNRSTRVHRRSVSTITNGST